MGSGLVEPAENLLNKALDPDEHNGYLPAAWGVYMVLHDNVSDELEESDPVTRVWLAAAEANLAHTEWPGRRCVPP